MAVKKTFWYFLVILLLSLQSAYAEQGTENEYGSFEAQYIGPEKLKVGEPAEIMVTVTVRSATAVFIRPSYRKGYYNVSHHPDNFVPVSRERITKLHERMDVFHLTPGWSKTFRWTIVPNQKATENQVGLSVIVDFSKDGDGKLLWTKVEGPWILSELYEDKTETNSSLPDMSGTENILVYAVGAVVALGAILLFFIVSKFSPRQ